MKTLKDNIIKTKKRIKDLIDNWIINLDYNSSYRGKQINYIIEDEDLGNLFNKIDKIFGDFEEQEK